MPFDGAGNFTRNYSWTAEAAAGKTINPIELDADANDLAGGLSQAVLKIPQGTLTAPQKAALVAWMGGLLAANNGSDIASVATFLTNLGFAVSQSPGTLILTIPTPLSPVQIIVALVTLGGGVSAQVVGFPNGGFKNAPGVVACAVGNSANPVVANVSSVSAGSFQCNMSVVTASGPSAYPGGSFYYIAGGI